MRRILPSAVALLLMIPLAAWSAFHIELVASSPGADEVLGSAPAEIKLEFSVPTDTARSTFSVRGPAGRVELGPVTPGNSLKVLQARVTGTMPAGSYTVSWVAAPVGDHTVRGRYSFRVGSGR